MLEHEGFELAEVAQAQEQVKHVAGHLVLRGKHGEEGTRKGSRAKSKVEEKGGIERGGADERACGGKKHTRIETKQAVAALINSHCD